LKVAKFHCGTILYPIEVMEDEHNHEGERFEKNLFINQRIHCP